MTNRKRKVGQIGVKVEKAVSVGTPHARRQKNEKPMILSADQRDKIDNFRMVTRETEFEALKWLDQAAWATGSALQLYFKQKQATCNAVDLTADEEGQDAPESSTGGLGEILFNSFYGRFLQNIKQIDFGKLDDLKLPRVVVIGNESSGKSSTLERIAMFPFFPRDRDLCTRSDYFVTTT